MEGSLSHTATRDTAVAPRAPRPTTAPAAAHTVKDPVPLPLLPPGPPGPPATAAALRLQRSLNRGLRQAGPDTGALVYDLTAGRELYAVRPAVARAPASVEKIWTTVALMLKLGPSARLQTSVLGTGSLRGGTWHGNLYLRGGGDPTFGDQTFNRYWNHGEGPTPNQLVAQLQARGIRRVTGRLYADESLFDRRRGGLLTNYLPDIPDLGGQLSALTYDHGTTPAHYSPATFAAHETALTMRGGGIAVRASGHAATAPARARVLATVSSPPLSVMVRLMDVPSDDLFAEMFAKQLGVRFGAGGTISAGARVIAGTIAAAYGLHPRILDGSGLALRDRTSPLQIVQLLRAVWGTRVGRELAAALPTAGREGTMLGIGLRTPASGRCIAKTGSLTAVTNLAGYCRARNRHTLAFALFVDGPPNASGFALESRLVGDIAGY